MGLRIRSKGNYEKASKYLAKLEKKPIKAEILAKYGNEGVLELIKNTPVDSGKTRDSWYYKIVDDGKGTIRLEFLNSNLSDDWFPVAIYLQYGHATGTGGWVYGRDYINPVIQPVFDRLANEAWLEVTRI